MEREREGERAREHDGERDTKITHERNPDPIKCSRERTRGKRPHTSNSLTPHTHTPPGYSLPPPWPRGPAQQLWLGQTPARPFRSAPVPLPG